jgi:hypothetical protein
MTARVDVLVDPHDDVGTTRAIHRLATEQPSVLAVSVAPDERTPPAVVWAILRALGKRTDKLTDKTQPDWYQARSWLRAHLINELIVLRAQHLKPAFQQALTDLAEQTSSRITFVYSGPDSTHHQATITLDQLLKRPRTTPQPEPRSPPWPTIPRSHPWRLRYDCAQTLNRDSFRRVDSLLSATYNTLDRWLTAHHRHTPEDLSRAVSVMRIAHDPNQRHLRHCATTVLLHSRGITAVAPTRRPFTPRTPTTAEIDHALAYTNVPHAGYALAEKLTGLPDALLGLILGDQVTDTSIIGCAVPDRARPVLRILYTGNFPVLRKPPEPP